MIVAVVLTFAAPDGMLEDCVASVLAAGGVGRLVVVDNGDLATRRLIGITGITGGDTAVEVIVTGSNLGYAGGMNVGIRRALELGANAVLILNDDLVVEADAVRLLAAALDDVSQAGARLGAVQPKLLLASSEPPRVNSVGVVLGRDGAGTDIGSGELDGPTFEDLTEIEMFTGGAVLLSAAFLRDVGMFDERFFLYYEDVDLALRGGERGWTFRCEGRARVWHRGGASALHEGVRLRTVHLRERNRLWVLIRHRSSADTARGCWLSIRRMRWAPRWVHTGALAAGVAAAPRLLAARRVARKRPR